MIGFLVGVLVSAVAAIPAILLLWGGREAETRQKLKLWAIGTGIRFALIGVAVYYLFTQTTIHRLSTVFGVITGYFVIYIFEVRKALRS